MHIIRLLGTLPLKVCVIERNLNNSIYRCYLSCTFDHVTSFPKPLNDAPITFKIKLRLVCLADQFSYSLVLTLDSSFSIDHYMPFILDYSISKLFPGTTPILGLSYISVFKYTLPVPRRHSFPW